MKSFDLTQSINFFLLICCISLSANAKQKYTNLSTEMTSVFAEIRHYYIRVYPELEKSYGRIPEVYQPVHDSFKMEFLHKGNSDAATIYIVFFAFSEEETYLRKIDNDTASIDLLKIELNSSGNDYCQISSNDFVDSEGDYEEIGKSILAPQYSIWRTQLYLNGKNSSPMYELTLHSDLNKSFKILCKNIENYTYKQVAEKFLNQAGIYLFIVGNQKKN